MQFTVPSTVLNNLPIKCCHIKGSSSQFLGQAYKVLLMIEYGKISNSTSSQIQVGPIQCLDMRLYKPCSDLTEPNFGELLFQEKRSFRTKAPLTERKTKTEILNANFLFFLFFTLLQFLFFLHFFFSPHLSTRPRLFPDFLQDY